MKMSCMASRALPVLLLSVCVAATAAEPNQEPQTSAESAMKVSIDAKTGKLRAPTQEEAERLDRAATPAAATGARARASKSFVAPTDAAAARATVRTNAGGGVSAKLPEDLMSTLTVRRDASGQLQFEEHAGDGTHAHESAQGKTQEATHE